MAEHGDEQHLSRRGLIGGLAGAGTLGIASVVKARPAEAQAAAQYVVLGDENVATGATVLRAAAQDTTNSGDYDSEAVLRVEMTGDPDGEQPWLAAFRATAEQHYAVEGWSNHGPAAVRGYAGDGFGVLGESHNAPGVVGRAADDSRVPGVQAESGAAQLRLVPRGAAGIPTGELGAGSIYFDKTGDLYLKTTDGDGGWVRLVSENQLPTAGRVVPLATPVKAATATLVAGRGLTVVLDAGTGVPMTAGAVIGSVTAGSPHYVGRLELAPAGAETHAIAVSFRPGEPATAGFTCGVSQRPGGAAFRVTASGPGSETVRVRIDLTAYVAG